MTDSTASFESQPLPDQVEVIERLQSAAGVSASWDVMHRPSSPGSLRVRVRAADRALAQLEIEISSLSVEGVSKVAQPGFMRSALLELRDHRRGLRAALAAVSGKMQ